MERPVKTLRASFYCRRNGDETNYCYCEGNIKDLSLHVDYILKVMEDNYDYYIVEPFKQPELFV